jgi:muramoyltetrapeptide carboxypeptidase
MVDRIFNRRDFGKLLAAGAGAAALPAGAASRSKKPAVPAAKRMIKPARLREGDLVGLVTPSGHVSDTQIEKSIKNLESLGLRVKPGKYIREVRGNYAGTVSQRLEDLHAAFADPEVKGVWCATGGSGGISLLPHIDYALIGKNPKVFVGFSDTTALHLAIHRRTGLVTFHGPLGISTFSDYSAAQLRAVLMEPQSAWTIRMAQENRDKGVDSPAYAVRTIRRGAVEGRLIGGNLSMVAALAGTAYGAQFKDALLFLEDINEPPYKIDRMMTQLSMTEDFNHTAAMMLGIFNKCEATDKDPSLTLAETVDDQLGALKVPAAYGYSFGHIAYQMTLPYGVLARIDTDEETLTLQEAAVQF